MEMRNKLWVLIAILFSFLAMTGCGNSERVHKSWIVPPEGPRYEDSDILNNLKSRLSANPDLKDLAVNIDVRNGEVSINGLADNQTQIDQISMQTWLVDGVQKVDNQIHLKR
ncbi:BON domain-containing protein [Nitrosomonas sp. Nm58]|jgi:hyperosmotically inducible protein|uniref:BON domain-containing protein n=2 Tax=unclassified Nitrosomonas TaxID=2609265 RepID=UPI00089D92E7|nr:BON domain-containing protein [Nitrosomonas sp. Nm58]SDY72792.1 hyperosmotically inducible protein [Nitrosomonas sp. Nm58]